MTLTKEDWTVLHPVDRVTEVHSHQVASETEEQLSNGDLAYMWQTILTTDVSVLDSAEVWDCSASGNTLFQMLLISTMCCYTPLPPTLPPCCLQLTKCSHERCLFYRWYTTRRVATGTAATVHGIELCRMCSYFTENVISHRVWARMGYKRLQDRCIVTQW